MAYRRRLSFWILLSKSVRMRHRATCVQGLIFEGDALEKNHNGRHSTFEALRVSLRPTLHLEWSHDLPTDL